MPIKSNAGGFELNICQAKHKSLIAAHMVVSGILILTDRPSEVLYFYGQLQVIPRSIPMIVLIIISIIAIW